MAGYELTPEEIKLFLEEAQEQLQIMEETLIALEEDPDNPALIQEIFRAAHTLKGGSATAGFDNVARLTHAMESLLDLVRQGHRTMSTEIADALFDGVDLLRRCLEAIAQHGDASQVDVEFLIAQLEEEIESSGDGAAASGDGDAGEAGREGEDEGRWETGEASEVGPAESDAARASGGAGSGGELALEVHIAPGAPMTSVRAYQVLLALEDFGRITSCEPKREIIEQGSATIATLRVVVETSKSLEAIRQVLLEIPDIVAVEPFAAESAGRAKGETAAPAMGESGASRVFGAPDAAGASDLQDGEAVSGAAGGRDADAPGAERTSEVPGAPRAAGPQAAPHDAGAQEAPGVTGAPGIAGAPTAQGVSRTATAAAAGSKGRAETSAAAGRDGGQGTPSSSLGNTIRVDVALLDNLMNLVGELVIDRTRLTQLAGADLSANALKEELSSVSNSLSRITTDLQDAIMQARMMPVDMLFKKFPRMIRDLSRQLGKEIDFEMSGNETELDRSVIEQIGDPLIHLLRNAVDHGIEPAEERLRMGKSPRGKVRLRAYHQENQIYIEVSDDGRGLDTEAIMRKAIDRGLLHPEEASRLSPDKIVEYIFQPGFSTASSVSAVSGRGVGMDVVRRNLEKVNGSVSVTTEKGKGTTFTIKLPLTLVIVQALMVEIADCVMAIPLSNVTEAVQVTPADVHLARGWEMIEVRGEMVPLLNPGEVWGPEWAVTAGGKRSVPVVILRSGSSPLGLKVSRLLGEQEIVIKTMGPVIGTVPGISGASILGDGRVALIVDPAGLTKAVQEQTA